VPRPGPFATLCRGGRGFARLPVIRLGSAAHSGFNPRWPQRRGRVMLSRFAILPASAYVLFIIGNCQRASVALPPEHRNGSNTCPPRQQLGMSTRLPRRPYGSAPSRRQTSKPLSRRPLRNLKPRYGACMPWRGDDPPQRRNHQGRLAASADVFRASWRSTNGKESLWPKKPHRLTAGRWTSGTLPKGRKRCNFRGIRADGWAFTVGFRRHGKRQWVCDRRS
jgi:hypothetical protein